MPFSRAPTAFVPTVTPPPRPALAHLAPGTVVSRYRIESVLGEGGMGTVYLARQEKPDRSVALKVVRPGYATERMLRRFEMEAEVLGRLLHPGIAQIYEAGTADAGAGPQPFFAMELVKGVPLTHYAHERKLSTRERLELVAKVCDAVQHAHQKGVIHRDLKPGNILVTEEGQPKILDFGVARATDSDLQQTTVQTDVGAIIGTIPYMSPEQVSGDPAELDTRSDVYALGVIAYELLVGRLPYDLERKMIHEAARIIREEEPTRLSSIDRALRGDVETIVAHALEKDKARRYGAASALAADIRRYLSDEPIAARPASTWYQISKFSRRNKGLVAGVAAAFVFLAAGLVTSLVQRAEAVSARNAERAARESEADQRKIAEEQRDAAVKARRESDLTAEFMSDTLKGAGPSVARGRDSTMLKEMMDAAAARIENGDLSSAPRAELRLRATIGSTYGQLAQYDDALRILDPAVALARSLHDGDHADTADALGRLGSLLQDRGDLEGAERLHRESLEMRRRLFPGDHSDVAMSLNNLGTILQDRGDLAGAESAHRESLEMIRRILPGDHDEVAAGLGNLALLLQTRGDLAQAEFLCRESLEMKERLFPGDHPDVALGLNNLAFLLQARGNPAGAEPLYRKSLEMRKRILPADHPDVAESLTNLGYLLFARGDLTGAEPCYREALASSRLHFSGDHWKLAAGLNNLATLLSTLGEQQEAESLARESLEMLRRLLPGDHPYVATSLNNLAHMLQTSGNLAGAEPLFREALEMRRRIYPEDHPEVAQSLGNLALLLQARNDLGAAELFSSEALNMRRRLFPGDHPDVASSCLDVATLLRIRGDLAGAEQLYRESVSMMERTIGRDHWSAFYARYGLGLTLRDLGRFAEAEPELVEAERGLSIAQGVPKGRHAPCIVALVSLYESWDRSEPGKGYDAKAAEWKARLDALAPPPDPATATSPAPK